MRVSPKLFRSTTAVILIFLILVGLHFLGWLRPVESGLSFVLEPVARGARSLVTRVGNGIRLIGQVSELDSENQRLTEDLLSAEVEIAQLRESQAELAALQEQLNAPLAPEIETVTARVIGHDAISGTKRLIISLGGRDDLSVGMSVLSPDGIFLGSVEEVQAGQAEILLIADDRSAVPARVSESRATGILRGELGLGVTMTDIPQQDTVNEGDQVVTSGLGGSMPAGLPIGSVEMIESAANALFQEARVRPYVDVTSLEYVQVITSFK